MAAKTPPIRMTCCCDLTVRHSPLTALAVGAGAHSPILQKVVVGCLPSFATCQVLLQLPSRNCGHRHPPVFSLTAVAITCKNLDFIVSILIYCPM
ncbi:Hypothetical predicted protein [Cloeon dipterum]|uniref:Uncharacterized protein n=1 Tax=Cloeon dipterum TaxID=197152 RepID=A0A8S1DE73_9INSE|nr:Hypothetical predicted protein [Cloeon dipterum]